MPNARYSSYYYLLFYLFDGIPLLYHYTIIMKDGEAPKKMYYYSS